MPIRPASWREQTIYVKGGTPKQVTFFDTKPTILHIYNYSTTDILYTGKSTSVTNTKNYVRQIIAGGIAVLCNPAGYNEIYLYCATDCTVVVGSGEGDVAPNDLDKIVQTTFLTNSTNTTNQVFNMYAPATPTISNVTLTNANTEYYVDIPAGTRKFVCNIQDFDTDTILQFYYSTGATATMKVKGDAIYQLENVNLVNGLRIYFKSSVAGKVMQIESWK